MFLAIFGIILIVLSLALVVVNSRAVKRGDVRYESRLAEALVAEQFAEAEYQRFNAWMNANTTDERKDIDPEGKWQHSSAYDVRRRVENAFNQAERNLDIVKSEAPTFAPKSLIWGIAGGMVVIGLLMVLSQSFYRQDIGEAKVQVSWSGQLVGQSTTPGFHLKAPWVSVRTFDVRNNLVTYIGSSEDGQPLPEYDGNVTTGPQITFQDKEGVTGNVDITLRYSIEPGSVLDVYSQFGTQENFVNKVISQGVRTDTRTAPSTRGTLEVYSDRAGLAADIRALLEKRWEGMGIIIEDVAVQEIRYSKDVQARFDDAQAARIAVTKAEADQEAAKVTAETKVIEAQGIADAAVVAAQGQSDANDLLTKSLTPEVLTQRYIDALKAGTIYVVPEGSTPLITTGSK